MKHVKTIIFISAAVLGGLGAVMAIANPSQSAYEEYATRRLTVYIKEEVCNKAPKVFGDFLQRNCNTLVDSSHSGVQRVIATNTQRQNFIFFSIYRTDFSVSPVIPSYHFETVGALQNFYTYTVEER